MRSQVLPYDQGAAGFWKDMVQPLQRKLFRVVNELRTNGRENVMARSRQFQSRWLCRPEGALTYANRRNQCGELEQDNQKEHPASLYANVSSCRIQLELHALTTRMVLLS